VGLEGTEEIRQQVRLGVSVIGSQDRAQVDRMPVQASMLGPLRREIKNTSNAESNILYNVAYAARTHLHGFIGGNQSDASSYHTELN
jgi:hypothetical protein